MAASCSIKFELIGYSPVCFSSFQNWESGNFSPFCLRRKLSAYSFHADPARIVCTIVCEACQNASFGDFWLSLAFLRFEAYKSLCVAISSGQLAKFLGQSCAHCTRNRTKGYVSSGYVMLVQVRLPCTDMTLAPLFGKAIFISCV